MAETLVNKNQEGEGIWTSDNLVAGTDISFTQVPQPVIDENTLGVWHFDGNNDNAISESSLQLAASSYYGFSTEIYKFGSASGTMEEPYPNQRTTTILAHTNFTQGATYTLDFWVRTPGASLTGGRNFFVIYNSISTYISVFANKIRIQGANIYTSVSPDTWHHIAVVVSGSEWKFFVDGILLYTLTQSGRLCFDLGQETGSGISYIDELRVSNVARWTSDFTPYTVPYSASAGHAQYQINNTQDISGKQDALTTATGYDATKTQVLKNVNGTLTWVDEA